MAKREMTAEEILQDMNQEVSITFKKKDWQAIETMLACAAVDELTKNGITDWYKMINEARDMIRNKIYK